MTDTTYEVRIVIRTNRPLTDEELDAVADVSDGFPGALHDELVYDHDLNHGAVTVEAHGPRQVAV